MFLKITMGSPLFSGLFTVLSEEKQRVINFEKWQVVNLPNYNFNVLTQQSPYHLFKSPVAWKFEGEVDNKVWQEVKGFPGYYEPNKRTKAGKEMRQRILDASGNAFNRFSFFDMFHTSHPFDGRTFMLPMGFCHENVIYMYFDDWNYNDICEKCPSMFEEITRAEWVEAASSYNRASSSELQNGLRQLRLTTVRVFPSHR